MKINPEKEQFRSAYAVPIIQATKFVAGLASFKFCGNSSLGIDDSTCTILFLCTKLSTNISAPISILAKAVEELKMPPNFVASELPQHTIVVAIDPFCLLTLSLFHVSH